MLRRQGIAHGEVDGQLRMVGVAGLSSRDKGVDVVSSTNLSLPQRQMTLFWDIVL